METRDVDIRVGGVTLTGTLGVPAQARGLVVFAHGSGSSRMSPRNRFVAGELCAAGLATLLLDLLTESEEALDAATAGLRLDVPSLSGRLLGAIDRAAGEPDLAHLCMGVFGSSTGAAAALIAAARRPRAVRAVVSRGGRPDLAAEALPRVLAPTLLIVGTDDRGVIDLNEEAYAHLPAEKRLVLVPGATHLFEEPGALEQVARLATDWFTAHLAAGVETAHP